MKNKNMIYPIILIGFVYLFTSSCKKDSSDNSINTVTDVDDNVYHTVIIGTQTWMVENLRTTHYNDKSPITKVAGNKGWAGLSTSAYSWYNNDSVKYYSTYGALYNWYAASNLKLCPTGWHVPNDAEWTILTNNLGGESIAGDKLKESGSSHWMAPNGGNNSTKFNALPGGCRSFDGSYEDLLYDGYWWSSSENPQSSNSSCAWNRVLDSSGHGVNRSYYAKEEGNSVRCIKGYLGK